MFDWKELRLIFNDPLDLIIYNLNQTLLKIKRLNLFFLRK